MIDPHIKMISIVGPTASGKTALAIDLAIKYGGEIVCADSRTIYRGMNIGTAKPTDEEQAKVPHHMLNLVEPGEPYTVVDFKRQAEEVINSIGARGKVPFLVGGSGLYIDSILYDYQFPEPKSTMSFGGLSDEALRQELAKADPVAYESIDIANRRRVERALATVGVGKTKRSLIRPNTLVLGMAVNKEVIRKRIEARIDIMLSQGFIKEVAWLGETYGWESEAMSGVGYRAFKAVILGHSSAEVGRQQFIDGDCKLVKKQLTWFKRNHEIHWLDEPGGATALVGAFLARDV